MSDPATRAMAAKMLSRPAGRVFVSRYGRFPECALVVQEDAWAGAPLDGRVIREWDCGLRPGDRLPSEQERQGDVPRASLADPRVISEVLDWVRQEGRVALLRFEAPRETAGVGSADMRAQDTLIGALQILRKEGT